MSIDQVHVGLRKLLATAAMLSLSFLALPSQTQASDYDEAMRYLNSDKSTDRAFAFSVFGLMGRDAVGASRLMVHSLVNDSDAAVRQAATLALSKSNPEVYTPVMSILYGTMPDVRLQGLQELANLGDAGAPAIPALGNYLRSAEGADRRVALWAMFNVARNDPKAKEWFVYLAGQDPEPKTQIYALQLLAKTRDPQTHMATFLAALQEQREPQVRLATVNILGQIGDKKALQTLEELKKDQSSFIRSAAAEALEKHQKKAK